MITLFPDKPQQAETTQENLSQAMYDETHNPVYREEHDLPYVWLCDGVTYVYKDKDGKQYKTNGLGACDQNDDREILYSSEADDFEFVGYEARDCGHGTPQEDIELFTK